MKFFLAKYPALLKWLYPGRISRLLTKDSVYLTFDDGPIPEVTPWVLDELKKHNARATFFCIGDNVRKHPEIFRRILEEGHCVGNHTYHHLNGWQTSSEEYLENIKKSEEIMKASVSMHVDSKNPKFNLFRPPYGRIKNSQARAIKKNGFEIVMWDVLSGDYDNDLSAEVCYQNVIKNTVPGSTIVLHDSLKAEKNLRELLPRLLKYYKIKGLEFRSLTDIP